MEPILQVKDLTHTYGAGTPFQRSAVEHMSFDVNEGEFLGIIGHTGSGKSTLIQHLNGLLQPTAGEILLRGKNIWAEPKKIREVRFKVGLVFQYPEYQLFEETVYKDIAFGPANQGKTGDELDHAVREAAKLVGIRDDQLEKSPFELSGGQKRRVALAGMSTPRRFNSMAIRVICGTSRPAESSSSPRANTSAGVPCISTWAFFSTKMRSTFRAISSMLWLTRMMVLPLLR